MWDKDPLGQEKMGHVTFPLAQLKEKGNVWDDLIFRFSEKCNHFTPSCPELLSIQFSTSLRFERLISTNSYTSVFFN